MLKAIELISILVLKGDPVTAGVIKSIVKGVFDANSQCFVAECGVYLS